MQAVRAKEATVTPKLMRMMRLRVADRCMLHTSRKTSRFSLISCSTSPNYQKRYTTGTAAVLPALLLHNKHGQCRASPEEVKIITMTHQEYTDKAVWACPQSCCVKVCIAISHTTSSIFRACRTGL
jgi:hypothetical protein